MINHRRAVLVVATVLAAFARANPSSQSSGSRQRFLPIKAPETEPSAAPPALIVVQHWDEDLKRLVPTK